MKKFLAFLLAGMLMVVPVFAETIDLSSMSLEELIQLRDSVNAAINKQQGFDFADSKIGMGYYDAGADIKPGKFELICTFAEIDEDYGSQCNVAVVSDRGEDASVIVKFGGIMPGQQISIELEEGNVLVIARGNFLIQSSEHSWAP